ncbi:MAG: phosphatase PAP2 family protein [Anaerolineae bacterium]|nr:phosphatase PAP2 family protein [Anaerolineae bacterium]
MPSEFKKQLVIQLLGVFGLLIALLVLTGTFPSTEVIAGAFVFVFMWTKNGRKFLVEFLPFLLLLITYKQMRNFADDLTPTDINITNLIDWEKGLFGGTLPNHYIQQHLWGQFYTPALDVLTNFLYLSHFLSPLILAVLLWQRNRAEYWAFAIGIVALSYAAFATYILFPAAPPWWATLHGYITDQPVTLDHFVASANALADNANPVAAMPSLHAAYPSYIALVSIRVWGKRGIPVILLPAGVMFATFYLGHHYVIDAIAGATYALVAFLVVYPWAQRFTTSHDVFRRKPLVPGQQH